MSRTMRSYCLIMLIAAISLALPGLSSERDKSLVSLAKNAEREAPEYTFSVTPRSIMTSYYDYMIGGYNNLPLQTIPQSAGGGYFMTYHARRQPTSSRRVFYSYLDVQGNILNNNEITAVNTNEGYPDVAVDPVSGKPMYVWHGNADTDDYYEIIFVADAFISGIAGLMDLVEIVIDNPISITALDGSTTTDNEFIWPSIAIGPSPFAGKRRVYVLARNATSHNASLGGNVYLGYADFSAYDIEMGTQFVWSYTSIPELDAWNIDTAVTRRPFGSLLADSSGNIYYAGYHVATNADMSESLNEQELDIFKCPNFGEGTWTRESSYSTLPSWNPPSEPGGFDGYFTDDGDAPYEDSELNWKINNSGHLNASIDGNGRIHIPGLWALTAEQDTYFPGLQFMKEAIYDPLTNDFTIQDIYPQKDPTDTFNSCFTPWDIEAPWGEVDEYIDGYPLMVTDWPFPHWDNSAHYNSMMFYYNNVKITQANEQGVMAAVWQDSQRSMGNNEGSADILIAVSPNGGETWLEPIILNDINNPQLTGMCPMWVYPADKMIYTGIGEGWKWAKLGLMFYDDYTWGANALSPAYHPTNSGGEVKFMELNIGYQFVDIETVAAPFIIPWGGTYSDPVLVSLETATAGAHIYYTLDGSVPNSGSTQYEGYIPISANTTLRAYADASGYYPSNFVTAQFQFQVATPVFSLEGGTYTQPVEITLSCPTPDSQIRYTTDGSEPDANSSLYSQAFILPLDSSATIKVRAFRTGWNSSASATEEYIITGSLSAPAISPPPGTFYLPITVTISSSDEYNVIRYTVDGSDPTEDSALYLAPLAVSQTTTVKARVFRSGWVASPVVESVYGFPEYTTGIRKAYPNPFAGLLNIEMGVKEAGQSYKLAIYNIKGECVFTYENQQQGVFQYQWNGRDKNNKRLAAGIYLLRFTAGTKVQTSKIMLLGEGRN